MLSALLGGKGKLFTLGANRSTRRDMDLLAPVFVQSDAHTFQRFVPALGTKLLVQQWGGAETCVTAKYPRLGFLK